MGLSYRLAAALLCAGLLPLALTTPVRAQVEDASESSEGTDNLDDTLAVGAGHTPRFILSPMARTAVRWRVNPDFRLEISSKYRHAGIEPPTRVRGTQVELSGVASVRLPGGVRWRNQITGRQAYVDFFGPRDYTSMIAVTGLSREFETRLDGLSVTPSFDLSYQQADLRAINRFKYTWEVGFSYGLTDNLELSIAPHFDIRQYTAQPLKRIDKTWRMGFALDYQVMPGFILGAELGYEHTHTNVSAAKFARWILEPHLSYQYRF